jgi:Flp pilus assembly protein TadG
MTLRARFRRSDAGQALVEFALVMPIVLLMLVGIIEFGRAWNVQQVMTDAAREGARHAVLANPAITQASVVATINAALGRAAIDTNTTQITLLGFRSGTGNLLTVDVQHPYQFRFLGALINLAGLGQDGYVLLKTQFVMRNE